MPKVIKFKRGLDIRLKGKADKVLTDAGKPELFAVRPQDIKGLDPRVLVKPGQEVMTGTPLVCDKAHPEIVLVSPAAGTVESVERGERRKLLDIVVRNGQNDVHEPLVKADPSSLEPGQIRDQILKSGLWPALIQRPYGIMASPAATPRDIFISGFDSAPLGADYDFILKDDAAAFAAGIRALQKMTKGKVFLSLRPDQEKSPVFSNLPGIEYNYFIGPHPSGNAGIQIHHLSPVNKGDIVWTISPQHVALIGRTFLLGHADYTWTVAVAGSYTRQPGYYKTIMGESISQILKGNLAEKELPPRIITGNVLTGSMTATDNYIGFYDSLISVIPEGKYFTLLGWASPGLNKYSKTRTFLSSLVPKKEWDLDTNLNGGHRAFVMSGQYEKVVPMDIYPVYLLKAILSGDIDRMEQLGIYEVIEEDLALCEFVCTSKIDVQEILRNGLDLMRKEMS